MAELFLVWNQEVVVELSKLCMLAVFIAITRFESYIFLQFLSTRKVYLYQEGLFKLKETGWIRIAGLKGTSKTEEHLNHTKEA